MAPCNRHLRIFFQCAVTYGLHILQGDYRQARLPKMWPPYERRGASHGIPQKNMANLPKQKLLAHLPMSRMFA
jgi:hypothetical protein